MNAHRFLLGLCGAAAPSCAGYFILDAIELGRVQGRGGSYGLEDSPFSFFTLLAVYLAVVAAGLLAVVRASGRGD